jgi:hypothetical protein
MTTVELPDSWHEQVEYETACAYADGYQQARNDIAAMVGELEQTWPHPQPRTPQQVAATAETKVQARIAAMEASAAKLHAHIGATEWAGLRNGAQLPDADWAPDTTALAAKAQQAAAIAAPYQPEPCGLCNPRPHELCRCRGISTPRPHVTRHRRAA